MKLLVNGIEVKTVAELEKAMQWENQKGEYAEVVYVAENKEDYKKFAPMSYKEFEGTAILKTVSDEDRNNIVKYDFSRNWYNDNIECTEPVNDPNYPEGSCRAYSKQLSIKYNVSKLAKELKLA